MSLTAQAACTVVALLGPFPGPFPMRRIPRVHRSGNDLAARLLRGNTAAVRAQSFHRNFDLVLYHLVHVEGIIIVALPPLPRRATHTFPVAGGVIVVVVEVRLSARRGISGAMIEHTVIDYGRGSTAKMRQQYSWYQNMSFERVKVSVGRNMLGVNPRSPIYIAPLVISRVVVHFVFILL